MAASHLSGPLFVGTNKDAGGATPTYNQGSVQLSQTGTISQTAAGTTDLTFNLPANSQITAFDIDANVAWDSVTSAGLTIGTASAGTQYVSSQNVKTLSGRAAITFTNAQLIAMANISTNTAVVATVVSVGTTTVGTVRVTVKYIQN